jgi:hypothetical protein
LNLWTVEPNALKSKMTVEKCHLTISLGLYNKVALNSGLIYFILFYNKVLEILSMSFEIIRGQVNKYVTNGYRT